MADRRPVNLRSMAVACARQPTRGDRGRRWIAHSDHARRPTGGPRRRHFRGEGCGPHQTCRTAWIPAPRSLGRPLVAKEKRPRALVEFAPRGVEARGLSRDDFLAADESWESPEGDVDYVAIAMWRLKSDAKRALGDISALAVGPDRSLWLLSDKSRCVARLALDTPQRPSHSKIRHFQEIWRLPKHTKKPEGIAAVDVDQLPLQWTPSRCSIMALS